MKTKTTNKNYVYKNVVKKYLKDAWAHYDKCKVIPDNEDLAGCIVEFWSDDLGFDYTDEHYDGIFKALQA